MELLKVCNYDENDVILLNEIWQIKEFEEVTIKGYKLTNILQREQRGGGVAIYVKENIKFVNLKTIYKEGVIEMTGIKVGNVNIYSLYRPPAGNKTTFIDELTNLLDSQGNKKIIIGGDWNLNNLVNNNILATIGTIFNMNFKINSVTRPASGTCIDNFLTNMDGRFWVTNHMIADHLAIRGEIVTKIERKKLNFIYRLMKENNWKSFNSDLKKIQIKGSTVEEKWNHLSSEIKKVVESSFPEITSKNQRTFQLTKGLQVSRDKKNKLLKRYKTGKIRKEVYIHYNNIYRKLVFKLKEDSFITNLGKAGHNGRKKWKILKEELLILKERENITEISANNILVTDKKVVAEAFSNHFKTCASTLLKDIPTGTLDLSNIIQGERWDIPHTSELEIEKIINSLENKNSCGHDLLSNRMIKMEKHWFKGILSPLINESLDQGFFPTVLKHAVVIPIFKKGDKTNLHNYRPIALLPIMSKIFERVINNRITDILDKRDYIDINQYGFRKKHSTEDAIITFTNKIEQELSKGNQTISVFVDVTKAFDSCDHNIILSKLEKIGLQGNGLKLIESYLNNREQEIWVNGVKGGKFKLNIGVGQGTILGPTFFKIYIMDLHLATNLFCVKFADDSNFIGSSKTREGVEILVNIELQKINNWFRNNKLTLHPGKSKFMIHSKDKLIELRIGNNLIERVGYGLQEESVKFLGINLDENLDWKIHCKHVEKKINKGNYLLWRYKKQLSKKTKKLIYESFVRSHICYCLVVWGQAALKSKGLQQKIRKIINKFGPHLYHTQWRLKENGIYSLEEEVRISESKITWKWCKDMLPKGIKNIITELPTLLRTRKFFFDTKWKQKSLAYRLASRASKEIVTLDKITTKNNLKVHFKKQIEETNTFVCQKRNCYICTHLRR